MTKEFTKERAEEKPLTVGGLIEILSKLPQDMQLIETRYSDYQFMTASEWSVVEAVIKPGGDWLMRADPTMSDDEREGAKKYLHVEGN